MCVCLIKFLFLAGAHLLITPVLGKAAWVYRAWIRSGHSDPNSFRAAAASGQDINPKRTQTPPCIIRSGVV